MGATTTATTRGSRRCKDRDRASLRRRRARRQRATCLRGTLSHPLSIPTARRRLPSTRASPRPRCTTLSPTASARSGSSRCTATARPRRRPPSQRRPSSTGSRSANRAYHRRSPSSRCATSSSSTSRCSPSTPRRSSNAPFQTASIRVASLRGRRAWSQWEAR